MSNLTETAPATASVSDFRYAGYVPRLAESIRNLTSVPAPAKIVVIFGSRLFRECIMRALDAAIPCSLTDFSTVEDWIAAEPVSGASLVLLGLTASHHGQENVIGSVVAKAGEAPVVVMGDREDSAFIYGILSNGVRGYIPTSMAFEVTVGALQVVRAGGSFAPASCLLAKPVEPAAPETADVMSPLFTAKQLAVIGAIRKGKSNKTIAYELNMCESTVKVHVRNIMKKMKAKNRTQIAFFANEMLTQDGRAAMAQQMQSAD